MLKYTVNQTCKGRQLLALFRSFERKVRATNPIWAMGVGARNLVRHCTRSSFRAGNETMSWSSARCIKQ